MTKTGEDISKRLDVIPAQWRVLVTRRPKYVCRRCSGAVVQAHAPEHVAPGGLPTEAAIAHVIVSKFGDHSRFTVRLGSMRDKRALNSRLSDASDVAAQSTKLLANAVSRQASVLAYIDGFLAAATVLNKAADRNKFKTRVCSPRGRPSPQKDAPNYLRRHTRRFLARIRPVELLRALPFSEPRFPRYPGPIHHWAKSAR
ncbi:transposase [Bradyrhizobium sp. LA6.10]